MPANDVSRLYPSNRHILDYATGQRSVFFMHDSLQPTTLEDLCPAWITALLREHGSLREGEVTALESTIIGEGRGYLSITAKVALTYDRPQGQAPASVVVKLQPLEEDFRKMGEETHAFDREILFYDHVAPQIPTGLPRIYGYHREPPSQYIVMEDLSHLHIGDQIEQMHAPLVKSTAETMARLQAKFWNNDRLETLDWMPINNNLWPQFRERWPSFVEHFGYLASPEALDVGHRMAENVEELVETMISRPHTITHNDLREDNLIFGEPGTDQAVVIVDWQLATRAIGATDPIRLAAGSELAAERDGHEWDVVRVWYDTLLAEGVTNYTWEQAQYDTRLGLLSLLFLYTYFHPSMINAEGRSRKLVDLVFGGFFHTVLAIDAGRVVPR